KERLRKLTEEGKLKMVGERKGAHYVPAPNQRLDAKSGQDLKEQIIKLLEQIGEASLQEIEDRLKLLGIEIAGNNKRNYLTGLMSWDKDAFVAMGRGRYGLRER
ncbi:MAG: hypothetical protein HY692_08365, partial [Cyanobacteria bacterium NC_groundwater_1444_Ag_S-0.65um_54_12]|nr:hypothetical protein [Cyanobacteria bacterium NC_groundwater_1444_Ag_S-0.65um_54_12]